MLLNNTTKEDLSLSLQNRKILVTGVSRSLGIGAAITKRCAKVGASVAIHGCPNYDMKMKYPDATMFPSGRWGTPDDAAKLVQFLHSEHARWITGQVIASEGGFKR